MTAVRYGYDIFTKYAQSAGAHAGHIAFWVSISGLHPSRFHVKSNENNILGSFLRMFSYTGALGAVFSVC